MRSKRESTPKIPTMASCPPPAGSFISSPPTETDYVRVDTGVEQGDEITPHYDPMIAKLIVWGADRRQALARMRQALAQYRVVGVSNNVDFLARLVAVPSFANAELDTGLIEREQALLFPPAGEVPATCGWSLRWPSCCASSAWSKRRAAAAEPDSPWRALDGWRLNGRSGRQLAFRLGDKVQEVGVEVIAGRPPLDGRRPAVPRARDARRGQRVARPARRAPARAAVVTTGERRHVFFGDAPGRCRLWTRCYVGGEGEDVEAGCVRRCPARSIALMAEPGAMSRRARRCWFSRR